MHFTKAENKFKPLIDLFVVLHKRKQFLVKYLVLYN